MAHSARVAGAALVAALVAIAGAARAEIDPLAPTLDTTTPAGLDDEKTCLAAGGSWVVAPPHCEVDVKTTEDLGWDWSTFGEAAAERSDKAAAAWRGYIEGRLRARRLYTTSFLLTTSAFVARVDASLARAAKADAADRLSKDPSAAKRVAARARAVATWAALRTDVATVDAAVRKRLAERARPKPPPK